MRLKRRGAAAAVLGCSTFLSALLTASVARAEMGPYIPDERQRLKSYDIPRRPNRWRRLKKTVQMTETQQYSQQQSIRRTRTSPNQAQKHEVHRTLETTNNHPRQPKEACERAAEIYAIDGAQCICAHHPITPDTVTFNCYFPGCEECTNRWSRNDVVCAELSTRTVVSNLEGGSEPYEVSYTECFTYTRGRSDTVCYTEFIDSQDSVYGEQCLLDVNGSRCNACLTGTCTNDNELGRTNVGLSELDCSNIADGDNWNLCDTSGGVFDFRVPKNSVFLAFSEAETFSFDRCFISGIEENESNNQNKPESLPQAPKAPGGPVS
eukprot:scaffold1362_cov163-Amphora_coffeaeformis.AAC.7